MSCLRCLSSRGPSRTVLPVVTQGQVGHVLQSFERVWTNATDLIPGDEQIPRVAGDPRRDAPQLLGDALHGVRRLRALAEWRTRRVHGAEESSGGGEGEEEGEEEEEGAPVRIQHVGKCTSSVRVLREKQELK